SELATAFDWAPSGWPMAFSAELGADRTREESPAPATDHRTRELAVGLSGGQPPLSFSLWGEWTLEEDLAADRAFSTLACQQEIFLELTGAEASLTFSQSATYDQDMALVSHWAEARATVWNTSSPHQVRLEWGQGRDGGELDVGLSLVLSPTLSLELSARGRWDGAGGATELELGGGAAYELSWPAPFLPARGWVEGVIFLDRDGDGQGGDEEAGVAGAVVAANGVRASSDQDGRFRLPPLAPGQYSLDLERLPPGLQAQVDFPLVVEVEVGRRTRVDIPCRQLAAIRGVVFADQDQSGAREAGEPGLAGVSVVAVRAGQEMGRATTGASGQFTFPELEAGEYTVQLVADTLPERYRPTTPEWVEVSLTGGDSVQVAFGAWRPPRPVVLTYQPPVAEFEWRPVRPAAGEPVAFDASASSDPDGKIISYAWDFDGDGEPEGRGQQVEWTFPASGVHWVTLTVTDDDDFQDARRQPVEVTSADQ
ncbi:MAG: PKD domain-containing protein, partial [Candidatus Bipolaricaulaceae bacterium]